ncbi:hypothetical protein NFC79_14125 [Providencia stuartii]|nr:hypothetical protein NFC79_14125 [Providencia stuartii]
MTPTMIPHPIISTLNKYPLKAEVKKQILQQVLKLSLSSNMIKKNMAMKDGKSNIPVRISTLKRAHSEPANIHQKNITKLPVFGRTRSEPHNLHATYEGVAKAQPNYQTTQGLKNPAEIRQAKEEKIAAYRSLPEACKGFLNAKLSYKILVTYKKTDTGKIVKKFVVAYEDFKQGISVEDKHQYQQAKLKGVTPENRFQITKTVWFDLDKIKLIETPEEMARIANNSK